MLFSTSSFASPKPFRQLFRAQIPIGNALFIIMLSCFSFQSTSLSPSPALHQRPQLTTTTTAPTANSIRLTRFHPICESLRTLPLLLLREKRVIGVVNAIPSNSPN
jgi:hypothetical protein